MSASTPVGFCAKLSSSSRARRSGFTLVELLVVMGIIAVLVGVLLPALRRARESAQRVQCLSNMRQISNAMISFAMDHKGLMPAAAGGKCYKLDPVSDKFVQVVSDTDPQRIKLADWIAWQRKYDVWTNQTSTTMDNNITYSELVRYLGAKQLDHANPTEAHKVNLALESIYRCPSDDYISRPSHQDASHGWYRYSYAMNVGYANPPSKFGTFATGIRVDGMFNGKIGSIKNASNKVLLICEDYKTLDDGSFTPNANGWGTSMIDVVASRHQLQVKKATNYNNTTSLGVKEGTEDAYGNVAFCDGHGGFFSRKDALRGKYFGNPVPDPAGF